MSTSLAPAWAADSVVTKGSAASTSNPKGSALAATARPILPKPTTPSFLPLRRIIRIVSGTLPQPVVLTDRSRGMMRRFQASRSAMTWSDTSSTQ